MTTSTKNARTALSLLGNGLTELKNPELLAHFETVAKCLEDLAAKVDAFEAEKQARTAGSLADRVAILETAEEQRSAGEAKLAQDLKALNGSLERWLKNPFPKSTEVGLTGSMVRAGRPARTEAIRFDQAIWDKAVAMGLPVAGMTMAAIKDRVANG